MPIKASTVPFSQIGSCRISGVKKVQDRLGRVRRFPHVIVIQQKLAKVLVKATLACEDCLAESVWNPRGVGIERSFTVPAVSWPESGADVLMRIGLFWDRIRFRTCRCSAAVITGNREIERTPEEMYRVYFAVEVSRESLKERIGTAKYLSKTQAASGS